MPGFPKDRQGVGLVEVLMAILVITLTALGVLGFFSSGIGWIQIQGNSRAALEQAGARLEQLMAANSAGITPTNGNVNWLTCSGSPCTWTLSSSTTTEIIPVNDLGNLRMESTVQSLDDTFAGTGTSIRDTLKLTVKVWFTTDSTDDAFHRVELKTLRTP